MEETQTKEAEKKKYISRIGIVLGIIIVIASAGAAFYFHRQYKSAVMKTPESEIETITKEIGKTVDLPQGEAPTLATVTDKEKVKDQPFFARAENGDKVLIYTNAKKAYLFRPATKRIIEVTTLSENTGAEQQAHPAESSQEIVQTQVEQNVEEQQEKAKVAIYNGTSKKGISQAFEEFLTKTFSQTEVVAKETAARQDYEKTLIIDVSGKQSALVQEMATNLSAQVQTLPEGEVDPDADILIILGADRLK